MGNRYNNNTFKNSFQSLSGSIDTNQTENGFPYNLYKFRKVSGIIQLTPQGERNLSFSPNKFNQVINVYTGKEPVVLVWEGSTSIEVDEETKKMEKKYKIGNIETCYGNSPFEASIDNDSISLFGTEYATELISKSIVLTSTTWLPDNKDMMQYFYLVIDHRSQSYQWLELTSFAPNWNEETKQLDKVMLNFTSINLKYSSSGKQILDFIQLGAPGEGYAFPKETIEEDGNVIVSLDEEYLEDKNLVDKIQFDFVGASADSSFMIYGRQKTKNGVVSIPQRLFLYKSNFPKDSTFFYNQPNMNNYYSCDFRPTKLGMWESYRKAYKGNDLIGQSRILDKKEVLTGLNLSSGNLSNLKETNFDMQALNWNNDEILVIKSLGLSFNATPYVKSTIVNRQMNYADFFNMNSFVNFYTPSFNYDYDEITKYKISDVVGLLGGVFSTLVGGLDISFTTNQGLLATKQPLNLTIPCLSVLDTIGALNETSPIPVELFSDSSQNSIIAFDTKLRVSWNFSLTDRVRETSQIVLGADIGKGGQGIWDLKYLGQTQFEDGTYINRDKSPFELDLQFTSAVAPSTNEGWIIDYVDFKTIASCDVRISTYDKDGLMNYSSMFETVSKTIGDLRFWSNNIKFNYYEEFNTIGQIDWPAPIIPPVAGQKDPEEDKTIYSLQNQPVIAFIPAIRSSSIQSQGTWDKTWEETVDKTFYGGVYVNIFDATSILKLQDDILPFNFISKGISGTQKLTTRIQTDELQKYNLSLYESLTFFVENKSVTIPLNSTNKFSLEVETQAVQDWFADQQVSTSHYKLSSGKGTGTKPTSKKITASLIYEFSISFDDNNKLNVEIATVTGKLDGTPPLQLTYVENKIYPFFNRKTDGFWIAYQNIRYNGDLKPPVPLLSNVVLNAKKV